MHIRIKFYNQNKHKSIHKSRWHLTLVEKLNTFYENAPQVQFAHEQNAKISQKMSNSIICNSYIFSKNDFFN